MNQTPPAKPSHLPRLDALRGLAIILVFVYHLVYAGYHRDQLEWSGLFRDFRSPGDKTFFLFYPATFGWAGVCLFFVLSGFVIHYSFLSSSRPFSTGGFYWRRFWRIYPPYLIALVVCAVIRRPHPPGFARDFISHLVLVHNWSSSHFFGINGAFWSIATEMQFYAVYPLMLWLRRRFGISVVLRLALLVSLASTVMAVAIEPDISPEPVTCLLAMPLITWFDWVLGAFIAERFYRGQRWMPDDRRILGGLAVLGVVITFFRPTSVLSFTITSVACAVFLERLIWKVGSLSRLERWLIPAGLWSYSFYLWHVPPMLVAALILQRFGFTPVRYVVLAGPFLLVFILMFSRMMFRLVEARCTKMGACAASLASRYFGEGRRTGPAPHAAPVSMSDPQQLTALL